MRLSCPDCGYSRDLPEAQVPASPVRVTCPKCRCRFSWTAGSAELPQPVTLAAPVDAAESSPADRPKAGFWIRLVAATVDGALVSALQMVLGLALVTAGLNLTGDLGAEARMLTGFIAWSFGPALAVAYYVGFTGYCGQTPGKMAVRVKVIRNDGGEIGFGRALLRETVGKFLSGLLLCIGYLMIAFDEQKQGLHDKIAETYVIKL